MAKSENSQIYAVLLALAASILIALMTFQIGVAWAADGSALASAPEKTSVSDTSDGKDAPAKPTAKQLKAFKKATADFSLDLLGKCVEAKGENDNVTIAPLSIMNALAITANGSAGNTRAQMRNVLGGGASLSRINANLAWYNSKLVNAKKASLSSANAIWYHNDGSLKMKRKFLSTARKAYGATVSAADFSSSKTVDSINSWVADKTHDMIQKIIDQLEANDRIAIVNALYFDAEWRSPYTSYDVQDRPFTNASGATHDVAMMYGTENSYIQGTVDGKQVTGFKKPYAKGYQFVALLPEKGVSANQLAQSLTGNAFRKLVRTATSEPVHTGLPKFTVSYGNDDMSDQLQALGMRDAFSGAANFSKMATDANGDLCIGTVAHKTKVILDEQGTKAAAVTAVIAKNSAALWPEPKSVMLDHPFVYAIVDNATKLPVFIGTINDITESE